jgi:uncharacterized membrane protein SirB2
MAPPEATPPPDAPKDKVEHAIEFVTLQWEAEQENSRRLATRTNGILATIAIVSGLGIFKIEDIAKVAVPWASTMLRVMVGLVGLCILLGIIDVLDLRPRPRATGERWWRLFRKAFRLLRRAAAWFQGDGTDVEKHKLPFASSLLHGEAEPDTSRQVEDPDLLELKVEAVRKIHYYRLARAAIDLHVRNAERQAALVRGQGWLARAAFLAFAMAIVLAVSR